MLRLQLQTSCNFNLVRKRWGCHCNTTFWFKGQSQGFDYRATSCEGQGLKKIAILTLNKNDDDSMNATFQLRGWFMVWNAMTSYDTSWGSKKVVILAPKKKGCY